MTAAELRRRAAALPRVSLASLPTPLTEVPRFAEWVGGDVRMFLKRDDLTDTGLGGNKIRKLEFSLGAARAEGCDVIVHGLAGQSNYCRQTAAAAARLGMPCHLVLRSDHKTDDPPQGNRLLDYAFGADVHMVDAAEQRAAKADLVERLQADGHRPYVIGHRDEVLGAMAYALCLAEIVEQLDALGAAADYVCVSGRSGTHAGLVLGKRLLDVPGCVLGFQVSPEGGPEATQRRSRSCADAAAEAAELLGGDEAFAVDDIRTTDAYGGPAYGQPSPGCLEALLALGRTEGLLVGPVYTAKGLSGVADFVRTGVIEAGATVVFLHTGGLPETFAYNAEIIDHLTQSGNGRQQKQTNPEADPPS